MTPTPTAVPAPLPAAGQGLAVGLTEFNPNFVGQPGRPPASRAILGPLARRAGRRSGRRYFRHRRRLGGDPAIRRRPRRPHRLQRRLQPRRRALPALWRAARHAAGARLAPARGRLAGAGGDPAHAGVGRAAGRRLRAARHRDRARARRRTAGLQPYLQLVKDIINVGDQAGAQLRFWSAWNEPNHPRVHQPAAQPLRPAVAERAPPTPTRAWCARSRPRWPARRATSRSCSARPPDCWPGAAT